MKVAGPSHAAFEQRIRELEESLSSLAVRSLETKGLLDDEAFTGIVDRVMS